MVLFNTSSYEEEIFILLGKSTFNTDLSDLVSLYSNSLFKFSVHIVISWPFLANAKDIADIYSHCPCVNDNVDSKSLNALRGSSPVEEGNNQDDVAIQDIDPTKIEITLPDTIFTFGDLIATTGSTIYNKDVDLRDVQVIYDTEIKNKQ